jgi:AcrR family transcriptional regulator
MELTQRQDDIIQAAISIVARQGFKYLTTKNLAEKLHLTEAALYRHFDSKKDLISCILEYFETVSCGILSQIDAARLDPLESVHRFVMNRYELFSANPDLAQVMFSEELFRYDPIFAKQMQNITMIHRDAVVGYLIKAQEAGQISRVPEPAQLFRVIIGSMRFVVTQWNLSGQSFDLAREGEALFQTVKKLIEVHR